MSILFFIYDFVFILGFLAYLPVYAWKKKITFFALSQKFGFLKNLSLERSIWIQVVSVGEANLIGNLINRLKEVYDYPIVISTTTLTGNRIAKIKYSHLAKVIFFPLDVSFIVRRVLNMVKPKIFIAVETEIWPNLFWNLRKKNIPIIIVNGRISDKAFKRYKLIRPIIKRVINKCSYIGVQSKTYKERFSYLGAGEEKIIISGNMKFESIFVDQESLLKAKDKYLPVLKQKDNVLFIAASTHPPEEKIIVDVYSDILKSLGGVNLVIAPRHPQRVAAIEKVIRFRGFNPVRTSKILSVSGTKNDVFIVDTIGELLYFYSIADVCFVGGSLSEDGGHNILEPIYFLKPTVFGPHMDNFRDIEETVLEKGSGIKVRDTVELSHVLLGLIRDKALRDNLRDKCHKVFVDERRGLEKNLQIILKVLGQETN